MSNWYEPGFTVIKERAIAMYPDEADDFDDYADTGCPDQEHPDAQPSCLQCPLPECRFEIHDLDYYSKRKR